MIKSIMHFAYMASFLPFRTTERRGRSRGTHASSGPELRASLANEGGDIQSPTLYTHSGTKSAPPGPGIPVILLLFRTETLAPWRRPQTYLEYA